MKYEVGQEVWVKREVGEVDPYSATQPLGLVIWNRDRSKVKTLFWPNADELRGFAAAFVVEAKYDVAVLAESLDSADWVAGFQRGRAYFAGVED